MIEGGVQQPDTGVWVHKNLYGHRILNSKWLAGIDTTA